jgi:segregation and condensation protein B
MTTLHTNGATIVQGELDLDLGERFVQAGGERIPLLAALESLLFVAAEPVEPAQLAHTLELDLATVEKSIHTLAHRYSTTGRGLRLQERKGKYQLVTLPAAASLVETFLSLDLTTRLSGPALETLAVVAYRQPVTRAQIEAVRGVDCAGVLRSLLQRGLIEEVGRLEVAGRPILYGVTDGFLQHFGLTSLEQLPPLATPDQDLLDSVTQLESLAAAGAT